MGWRAGLGIFVGALLPVPLALVLMATQHDTRPARAPSNLGPVLSFEERMQRTTYMRRCEKSAECEAPLGCMKHWRLTHSICLDSECVTDGQCEEGRSCQWFQTEGGGPRIGLCIHQGMRREGERCRSIPADRNEACEPGLHCFEGWCGRPCQGDTSERCEEGFFCAEDAAVCLPTCEGRGCPEGHQCVGFKKDPAPHGSTCAVVHGSNCQGSTCPEGQACYVFDVPRRPGEVWMECRQRCGKDRPECPEGLVCNRLFCRQPCDPQAPAACGSGEKCARFTPEEPWVCQPDW